MITSRVKFYVGPAGAEQLTCTCSNLITLAGRHDWLREPLGTNLALGEGTQTEVPEVSSLNNYVQSASGVYRTIESNKYDVGKGTVTSTLQLEVLYPIQQVANNYTEFGVYNTSENRLQTYALIRDSSGAPVVLTVVPGERVKVLYEIDYVLPANLAFDALVDGVQTRITQVVINNEARNTRRLPELEAYTKAAPATVPEPLQPVSGLSSRVSATYVEDSIIAEFPTNHSDSPEGVQLVVVGGLYRLAWHFDPPIKKGVKSMKLKYTHKLGGKDAD